MFNKTETICEERVCMSSFRKQKSRKMTAAKSIRMSSPPMPLPKKKESRWVAIDFNNKIIAEGSQPDKVREEALKISENFMLAFVPIDGATYVL